MIKLSDIDKMKTDLAEIIDDNDVAITIRRGSSTLDEQTVRIARTGGGREQDSAGAQQAVGSVVVVGDEDFDVAVGDRFNDGAGVLYQVTFVRPNRTVGVVAEARQVE